MTDDKRTDLPVSICNRKRKLASRMCDQMFKSGDYKAAQHYADMWNRYWILGGG